MIIAGMQKFSLIDYPGKIACVLFSLGCSFRCHYCHNPSLVDPLQYPSPFEEKEIFAFLENRKGKIDAVVLSGGEPTLHGDIVNFLEKIKKMDFLIKLDTNGTNPDIVKELIDRSLLDYIAMDIKAPIEKYASVIGKDIDTKCIEKSIKLLLQKEIPFEFRTTLVEGVHEKEDILSMAKMIKGAPLYVLQRFIPQVTLNPAYQEKSSFCDKKLSLLLPQIEQHVGKCLYR